MKNNRLVQSRGAAKINRTSSSWPSVAEWAPPVLAAPIRRQGTQSRMRPFARIKLINNGL